jgi:hypothetical protein
MYNHRSFEEKLHAAKACWKVEELKGRHAYLHGTGCSREEYDIIWLKSGHTTFAHGFGRMCGYYQEVRFNSITHEDKQFILGNFNIINNVPEYEGHDLRSTGCTGLHSLASSVIEVSEDGKFARSTYFTPGILMGAIGMDCKHRGGSWLWERYGSDFAYVDGEWKWFHEQVCPDISGCYDAGNWAYDQYTAYVANGNELPEMGPPPMDDDMEFHASFSPARLTEPGKLHYEYTPIQTIQNTVPYPVPFHTLDNRNTYSPSRNNPYAVSNERVDD